MVEDVTKTIKNTEEKNPTFDGGEASVYEIGYHIISSLHEEDTLAFATTLRSMVEKEGGTFVSEELGKPMTLAYDIVTAFGGKKQKYSESRFGWFKCTLPQKAVLKIKTALFAEQKLIRFCVFKTVREDTRAGKRIAREVPERAPRTPLEPLKIERRIPIAKEAPRQTLSDEEIDKTIEELIAS